MILTYGIKIHQWSTSTVTVIIKFHMFQSWCPLDKGREDVDGQILHHKQECSNKVAVLVLLLAVLGYISQSHHETDFFWCWHVKCSLNRLTSLCLLKINNQYQKSCLLWYIVDAAPGTTVPCTYAACCRKNRCLVCRVSIGQEEEINLCLRIVGGVWATRSGV